MIIIFKSLLDHLLQKKQCCKKSGGTQQNKQKLYFCYSEDLPQSIDCVKQIKLLLRQKDQDIEFIDLNILNITLEQLITKEEIREMIFLIESSTNGTYFDNQKNFFFSIQDAQQDQRVSKNLLKNLNFTMICLGNDSSFQKTGKSLSHKLQDLGAQQYIFLPSFNLMTNRDCNSQLKLFTSKLDKFFDPKSFKTKTFGRKKVIQEESNEEDIINEKFAHVEHFRDLEDLGAALKPKKENKMLTDLQRKIFTKQGYQLIGSHSAVKLCRWAKHMLKGEGGCYKYTCYGIRSHQCMESSFNLACANRCVFCWRHHQNPVGTDWRWAMDDPEYIVKECIKAQQFLVKQLKGMPKLVTDRWEEAMQPAHCAMSLIGEPIMFPKINACIRQLHKNKISSFMVTNGQFPDAIKNLEPVTQLYVSIDAFDKQTMKKVGRPLYRDFWERFLQCLRELNLKQQRTVYRLTLIKDWNLDQVQGYADLVKLGNPDFIEIKAVTFSGYSEKQYIKMSNVPYWNEVKDFSEKLQTILSNDYQLACAHEHSELVLLAHKKFLIDGKWNTWIDYPKFYQLVERYYETQEEFTSLDYSIQTPDWALYDSKEEGFSPEDVRVYSKTRQLQINEALKQKELEKQKQDA